MKRKALAAYQSEFALYLQNIKCPLLCNDMPKESASTAERRSPVKRRFVVNQSETVQYVLYYTKRKILLQNLHLVDKNFPSCRIRFKLLRDVASSKDCDLSGRSGMIAFIIGGFSLRKSYNMAVTESISVCRRLTFSVAYIRPSTNEVMKRCLK